MLYYGKVHKHGVILVRAVSNVNLPTLTVVNSSGLEWVQGCFGHTLGIIVDNSPH
jgi:hypothetical protein